MSDNKIEITVSVDTTEIDAIKKAKLYLEHYGNTELSEELDSLWETLAKAILSKA